MLQTWYGDGKNMTKAELIEYAKYCNDELAFEHLNGGFSEYPNFAEDMLRELLPRLSVKNLRWLISEIKSTSRIGIKKRKITCDSKIQGDK